jgi:hypoxanthine-guanine phosphoribosyltransferase
MTTSPTIGQPTLPSQGGISRTERIRARVTELVRRITAVLTRQGLIIPCLFAAAVFFLAPLGLLLAYSFGTVNLITYQVYFGWTFSN